MIKKLFLTQQDSWLTCK